MKKRPAIKFTSMLLIIASLIFGVTQISEIIPGILSPEVTINTPPPTDIPNDQNTIPDESDISAYYVAPLTQESNTHEGSTRYGATIVLGELDNVGRSTYAHIRLKDEHEPGYKDPATGKPREKRNERINVDPVGWKNFKIDGNWANNRCHLIGYQFSGLNDELRNLAPCTSYLNKGSEGAGTDQSNPDGMLYYEQKLDQWLANNPQAELDYYVQPLYTDHNTTPDAYYMQWVGISDSGEAIPIDIGGHSQIIASSIYGVILQNESPSYHVDTVTGIVTKK